MSQKISKDLWNAFVLAYVNFVVSQFEKSEEYLYMDDVEQEASIALERIRAVKEANSFRRLNVFDENGNFIKKDKIEIWLYHTEEKEKFIPVARVLLTKIIKTLLSDPLGMNDK